MEGGEEEEQVDSRLVREFIEKEVPDWDKDDDLGARARFKDFSGQRSDWESLYFFWRDLILGICRHFQIVFLRPCLVKEEWFNRRGLSPLCLDHVFRLMYNEGHLRRKHDLVYDPTTGPGILSQIFRKVTNLIITNINTSSSDENDVFIVISVLKEKAGQVLKRIEEEEEQVSSSFSIITIDRFHHLCGENGNGGASVISSAILSYLSSQRQARPFSLNTPHFNINIQGVKVSLSATSPVSSLSSLDYHLLHLISTRETLHHQLALIDKRCERSKKSALASLASGNKNVALRHMRAFKLADQSRLKCASLLNRVDQVLILIANADSTNKVSEAIRVGAQAIKENNVSVKDVEHSLQQLEESIDLQKQVENSLESSPSYTFGDDEDMEEEFKKLELEIGSGRNAHHPILEAEAHTAAGQTEALDTTESLSEAFSNLKFVDGLPSTAAGQDIAAKEKTNLELEAA